MASGNEAVVQASLDLSPFESQFKHVEDQVKTILGTVGAEAEAAGKHVAAGLGHAGAQGGKQLAEGVQRETAGLFANLKEKFADVGKLGMGMFVGGAGMGAVAALGGEFEKLIEKGRAAAEQKEALVKAFMATGMSAGQAEQAIKENSKTVSELSDEYLISGDAIKNATQAYLQFGGSADNLGAKQKVLIGLAERLKAKGMDEATAMQQAAIMVAKSGGEEAIGGLSKLGIAMDKNASASERFAVMQKEAAKGLKGLEETRDRDLGKMKQTEMMVAKLEKWFGSLLFNAIASVGAVVGDLVQWFIKYNDVALVLGATIAAVVIAVNASTIAAGAHAAMQGIEAGATWAMTAAQTALNVVMAANPIALVVIGLAALVAGVVLAYNHFVGFRAVVNAVGAAFMAFWETIKSIGAGVGKVIHGMFTLNFSEITDGISQATKAYADAAVNIGSSAKKAFDGTYADAQKATGDTAEAITEAKEATEDWATTIAKLGDAFDESMKKSKEAVTKGESALSGIVEEYEAKGMKRADAIRAAHRDARYKRELAEAREQAKRVAEMEATAKQSKIEVEGDKDKDKKKKPIRDTIKDEYAERKAAIADGVQQEKLLAQAALLAGAITKEQYNAQLRTIDKNAAAQSLALAQEFENDKRLALITNGHERFKIVQGFQRDERTAREAEGRATLAISDADAAREKAATKARLTDDVATLDAALAKKELTQAQYDARKLALQLAADLRDLEIARAHGEQTVELEQKIAGTRRAIDKARLDALAEFQAKARDLARQHDDARIAAIKNEGEREEATEKENYARRVADLEKEFKDEVGKFQFDEEQKNALRARYDDLEGDEFAAHQRRLLDIQVKALEARTGLVSAANDVWQNANEQLTTWMNTRWEAWGVKQHTIVGQMEQAILKSYAKFAAEWLGQQAVLVAKALLFSDKAAAASLSKGAASIVSAIASVIEWNVSTFGPFAIATIPAEIAALYELFAQGKKLVGMAKGGTVVGENGPELILPAETAVNYGVQVAEATARATERALSTMPTHQSHSNADVVDRLDRILANGGINRRDTHTVKTELVMKRSLRGNDLEAAIQSDAIRTSRLYQS